MGKIGIRELYAQRAVLSPYHSLKMATMVPIIKINRPVYLVGFEKIKGVTNKTITDASNNDARKRMNSVISPPLYAAYRTECTFSHIAFKTNAIKKIVSILLMEKVYRLECALVDEIRTGIASLSNAITQEHSSLH